MPRVEPLEITFGFLLNGKEPARLLTRFRCYIVSFGQDGCSRRRACKFIEV